jgi:putative membrane protein
VNTHRKLVVTALLVWYVLFSAVMAIAPANREFWVAANILPVMLVIVLTMTHRLFPLSTASYCLITLFLTLHTIGVHYTYSQVPLGGWMQQVLHLNRNHFDRIVHFSFGFLLTYPLEEWFRVCTCVRGWLIYYLPAMTILGLSGFWEILESWVARVFKPELGITFLGSQGDVWDAQKDMTAALYGSLLCVVLIVVGRTLIDRSFTRSPGSSQPLEESS